MTAQISITRVARVKQRTAQRQNNERLVATRGQEDYHARQQEMDENIDDDEDASNNQTKEIKKMFHQLLFLGSLRFTNSTTLDRNITGKCDEGRWKKHDEEDRSQQQKPQHSSARKPKTLEALIDDRANDTYP